MAQRRPLGDPTCAWPAQNPSVTSILAGRVTGTRGFRVLCAVLAPFTVVVPAVLVALALARPAAGPDADTSRPAQLIWAGCLAAAGAVFAWTVGRSGTTLSGRGIRRRWGWGTVQVPWGHVSGFAAYAGRRPGVWVLRAGEAPLQVPTPWHRLSFAEAVEAADRVNRACGIEPPPTWGAPIDDAPVPRPLSGGAEDPELRRILTGNVLRSGNGLVTALLLAPFGVLLPVVLCLMAAAPGTGDTSRSAQVAWGVALFVPYVVLVVLSAGTGSSVRAAGITARWCWRVHHVRWDDVQAFLPDAAGVVVLTRAGQRVRAATRLATTAGHERSAREAAYLNGSYGLGGRCASAPTAGSSSSSHAPPGAGTTRRPRPASGRWARARGAGRGGSTGAACSWCSRRPGRTRASSSRRSRAAAGPGRTSHRIGSSR